MPGSLSGLYGSSRQCCHSQDKIRHLVLGDQACIISPRKYDFFLKLDQLVIGRLPGYDNSEKSLEHVDRTWKVPPRRSLCSLKLAPFVASQESSIFSLGPLVDVQRPP